MMVGAAAHAVSAARMAIRILRENIFSSERFETEQRESEMSSDGENGAILHSRSGFGRHARLRLEYTSGLGIFTETESHPTAREDADG